MKNIVVALHPPHSTVKQLTPQEMWEKRDKGLCFYCDKNYVAVHKCQNQKILHLYISSEEELGDPEESFEGDEAAALQPPIELSASLMAVVVRISSIRLISKLCGREASFLVDSGVTHNFIDPMMAKKIGLPLPPYEYL